MPLSPEKSNLQKHYATRVVHVRFANNPHFVKTFYDNQWLYQKDRKKGKTPQYWEAHLIEMVRKWGNSVLEASLHDVGVLKKGTAENKIAQLVSNGHIL
jgi:sialic acid synthase SpsE